MAQGDRQRRFAVHHPEMLSLTRVMRTCTHSGEEAIFRPGIALPWRHCACFSRRRSVISKQGTKIGLVLASTSPARRALMDSLGVPYRAVPPGVAEDVPPGTSAREAVAMLARRKAEAVAAKHPDALVIGSDQLVSVDGEALGKPEDREAARAQLRRLSGRAHEIVTGVCLIRPASVAWASMASFASASVASFASASPALLEFVEVASLRLYALTDSEIEGYLDTEEWRGCAGGYRVEGRGQALFEAIEGDRTGVMGLPMVALVRSLRSLGVEFFSRE